MNKHLNEFPENINGQLNKIKNKMQYMKREFNKDTEILKIEIEILEMKSSISQIKNSVLNLANKLK
jgi:hypothetical protein